MSAKLTRRERRERVEHVLREHADRMARHEVLTDFFDRAGIGGLIQRDGKPREAAVLIARLEDAIERCHLRLTGAGSNGAADDPYAAYRDITERREQS